MATEIRIRIEDVESEVYRDMIVPDDLTIGDLGDIITALFDWSFDEDHRMTDSKGTVAGDEIVMAHMDGLRYLYKGGLWSASVTIKGERDGEPPMVTGYKWKYIGDTIEGPEDLNKMERDGSDASLPDHYLALKRFAELPRFDINEFNDWLRSCQRIVRPSGCRHRRRGRTHRPQRPLRSSTGTWCPDVSSRPPSRRALWPLSPP